MGLACALLALLLPAVAAAQSITATGAIQGSVIDTTGLAMPGVRVTAVETGSRAARQASTDDSEVGDELFETHGQITLPGRDGCW